MEGISIDIWGVGPGRPFDNFYQIEDLKFINDILHIRCARGEEFWIHRPEKIKKSNNSLTIQEANSIHEKLYAYAEEKIQENIIEVVYSKLNNKKIMIQYSGKINNVFKEKCFNDTPAFTCIGSNEILNKIFKIMKS